MKTLQLGIAAAVVSIGAAALSVAACTQPVPRCSVSSLTYFARYTPAPGAPAACSALKGEELTAAPYNPPVEGTQRFPNEPNINSTSFALKAVELEAVLARAEEAEVPIDETKVYSLAPFTTSAPDPNGYCYNGTFTQQTNFVVPALPEIPANPEHETEAVPAVPATTYAYDWSDVKVFVRSDAVGLQLTANVTRTVTEAGGAAVTCPYEVYAMAPAVACDPADSDPDTGYNVACDPDYDLDAGRITGSGINPDFLIVCDPDLHYCMPPAGSPLPALKPKS